MGEDGEEDESGDGVVKEDAEKDEDEGEEPVESEEVGASGSEDGTAEGKVGEAEKDE